MKKEVRVAVGGIIQGGNLCSDENQDFVGVIYDLVWSRLPGAKIFSQSRLHIAKSEYYKEIERQQCFWSGIFRMTEADVFIAYAPAVTMGTAQEALAAFKEGVLVIWITPYVDHWSVKYTADKIVTSLDELASYLWEDSFEIEVFSSGSKQRRIAQRRKLFAAADNFDSWDQAEIKK